MSLKKRVNKERITRSTRMKKWESIIAMICCSALSVDCAGLGGSVAGLVLGVFLGRFSRHSDKVEPSTTANDQHLFQSEGWEERRSYADWEPFRELGKDMIDYIVNYYKGVEARPVRAQVQPGYLKVRLNTLLPSNKISAVGERWSDIMVDVETKIMPGMTHWQHPRFFAYFPANSSPPAILGELVASMFNVIGFSWEASPAATELETIVMDLLAREMGLPSYFLSEGGGGGVIQGSASEATLVAMLAARTRALKRLRQESPDASDQEIFGRMTVYASDQAHSSVKKAALIAGIQFRTVPTSAMKNFAMSSAELELAMAEDRSKGFTPIFVCFNVGSTNTCAVDPVRALSETCRRCHSCEHRGCETMVPWLHVDAAYADRLLVNFDCSGMWVKNRSFLVDALSVTQSILSTKEHEQGLVIDYRNWQIPLGRKFRSLKIWFTLRAFGLEKIQGHIRRHIALALELETLIRMDNRFEVVTPTVFGLVCFRLRASDSANLKLRSVIVDSGLAYFVSTTIGSRTVLRIAIGSPATERKHVMELWHALQAAAGNVIEGDEEWERHLESGRGKYGAQDAEFQHEDQSIPTSMEEDTT
ncbi:unnamed protein product [Choristocarpus tenellus]